MLALLIGIFLGRCLLVAAWLAVAVPIGGALMMYGCVANWLVRWRRGGH